MSEVIEPLHYEQKYGRTWADVFSSGVFWLGMVGVLVVLYFIFRDFKITIPTWIFASIGASFLFIPFLINRAKEDANLLVVVSDSDTLTEYRIGRRYPFNIEGSPLIFTSETGVQRIVLTDIEKTENSVIGYSSELAEFSTFDYIRDTSTLRRLSQAFTEHLRGERLTQEMVALQVESKVSEYSETWLKMLYGVLDPSEIETLLNEALNDEKSPISEEVFEFDISES